MATIREWLTALDLERYADVFEREEVALDHLTELTDTNLKDLGLPLGPRKTILKAAAELRNSNSNISQAPPQFVERRKREPPVEPSPEPITGQFPSGERRQLTVMFCDLVGSTALSEKLDPEELRSLLHDYRNRCGKVISRYEGFVARYVGDGLLTYFGWPTAHEDDAERSIRAALEITQTIQHTSLTEKLSVRVGIATGAVVVGEQAGVGDQSKLAIGSTPNLAARLQGLAAPDQIVVASSTRRLIGNTFDLTDLGEHELKGIREPVHAWCIAGISEATSRFEASHGEQLTPLVGREREIGLLLDCWQRAQKSEGQIVVLSGEPGIGKSRVLSGFLERLELQGVQALRFQCSPFHTNSAYYPSIDNFERVLKFARDETSESRLDKLEALVVEGYGRPITDVRFIASILSIPFEDRYGKLAITPQKFKDETARALVDLSEAVARKHPSVILFEDLHWADPTSLEILGQLIDRTRTTPLLIVLTHRPEFQSRWSQHDHVTSLNLSKLTKAQSTAIVTELTKGKALPGDLLDQIVNRTDGVPLYLEELTKSILESGELREAQDDYVYVASTHRTNIPATLQDSLMARLDRLGTSKEMAQMGAAIGRIFSYALIAAVAPGSKTDLDAALNRLTASGLAFRKGTFPDVTYTFKHALVQDAAYESLLKSRRQALHGNIAEAIEQHVPQINTTKPEVLAHHYGHGGQASKAIPLWRKAGELALARMALAESISHLNKGLDVLATLAQSAERDAGELALRIPLGTAWIAFKGWATPEVWTSLHPALPLAKSLGQIDALPLIIWGLLMNLLTQGRVAESQVWADEILDVAKTTGHAGLQILGHTAAAARYFWMGNLIAALHHGEKVMELYRAEKHGHLLTMLNQDPKTVAGVYRAICTWMLGYPNKAVRLLAENESHARRLGHPFDLGFALSTGADVFDHLCDGKKQREYAAECERIGRENSMPFLWALLAPARYGLALIREGHVAEGYARLKTAHGVWEASGGKIRIPYVKAVLAEAMARQGDVDGALALIEQSITRVETPGCEERVHFAEILRLKGWMLSLKGDLDGAEKCFQASLAWAREQQAKSWELRTSTSLARLWQSQGKSKEALDLLTPILDWFTEGFDTKDLKGAKALLLELGMTA